MNIFVYKSYLSTLVKFWNCEENSFTFYVICCHIKNMSIASLRCLLSFDSSSRLRAVNSGSSVVRKVQAEWWYGWWVLQTVTRWRLHLEVQFLGDVPARTLPRRTMSRWDVISARRCSTSAIKIQARWERTVFSVVGLSLCPLLQLPTQSKLNLIFEVEMNNK